MLKRKSLTFFLGSIANAVCDMHGGNYEISMGSAAGSRRGRDSGKKNPFCTYTIGEWIYGIVAALSKSDMGGRG